MVQPFNELLVFAKRSVRADEPRISRRSRIQPAPDRLIHSFGVNAARFRSASSVAALRPSVIPALVSVKVIADIALPVIRGPIWDRQLT